LYKKNILSINRDIVAELVRKAFCQPAYSEAPRDDRLRAQAAAIFKKEQEYEYVIQASQPAASRPGRELYFTENGCAAPFGSLSVR
jgi:hypothetical protein